MHDLYGCLKRLACLTKQNVAGEAVVLMFNSAGAIAD